MTSIVWFSYPPDYPKLKKSVESVKALDPDARLFVAIKHGDNEPNIKGVEIIRSDFPQGQKLTGCETVMGIARTLASMGGDTVVKLDSDMIVKRSFWDYGGIMFRRQNRSYAGVYALGGDVAGMVAKSFADNPTQGGHEAIEICTRARSLRKGLTVATIQGSVPDCIQLQK